MYEQQQVILDISTNKFINDLCIQGLSTYKGRIDAVKIKYGFKSLVPIYVSEDCLLFPTVSPRNYECIWINYFKIKHIKKNQIIMKDNNKIDIRDKLISKQLKKCEEIVF
ncbi:competence protein ComK [Mycoplasmatota bacterium WC44]